MPPPAELSYDEILKFMLEHNGKVTNHELVKHFKVFLMNPDMRDEARTTFKKHVNTLANIKNQNNEKWLILKRKYLIANGKDQDADHQSNLDSPNVQISESTQYSEALPPPRPPLPLQLNQDFNILNNLLQENTLSSPQTPVGYDQSLSLSKESLLSVQSDDVPPKVHPRRKSSEKRSSIPSSQPLGIPNQDLSELLEASPVPLTTSQSETMLVDNEQTISVKERKQMFNRMASESDVLKSNKPNTSFGSQGADEEDRVSLDQKSEDPLDSKQKQWILCAAKGEYHALAKMCKENGKLVKTKDPFTTAMHWACKRGDENLVKLLGGVARHVVNERSDRFEDRFEECGSYEDLLLRGSRHVQTYVWHNANFPLQVASIQYVTNNVHFKISLSNARGYTPLHIAMQFRHENVYRLLVEVYDADPNIRDWSGRKPRQYLVHMDTSMSPGSYRKADSLDLRRTVASPPDIRITSSPSSPHSKKEGFLRIGSLNVRVKKTTEAFSNFLGVGATRSSAYMPKSAREDRRSEDYGQVHKTWGSADNIQKEDKVMPPPMSNKVRRRGASGRRGIGASHSRSTPSTPDQPRAQIGVSEEGDSDDSAAGFHSAWRQQRSSNCT